MATTAKLSWQAGSVGRAGRWKKKYKGKAHYFPGGRGKSDREAHGEAVKSWISLKAELDLNSPRRYETDYQKAIREWEDVLTWCQLHGDEKMENTASQKLKLLRAEYSKTKLARLNRRDLFENQFEQSIQHPDVFKSMTDAVTKQEELILEKARADRAEEKKTDAPIVGSKQRRNRFIDPKKFKDLVPTIADVENHLWKGQLESLQKTQELTKTKSVQSYFQKYLDTKLSDHKSELLSADRYNKTRFQLQHFVDWFGPSKSPEEINGQVLQSYRSRLLEEVNNNTWSFTTAKDRMSTVISFVRWLYVSEAITDLPRILSVKSRVLSISTSPQKIVVFSKEEITTLLSSALDRTKLYTLLMLNCGMTQKDISDLQFSELNWEERRIKRKRSKTKKHPNVPVVSYLLWDETFRLLEQECSQKREGRVLLNNNGEPLLFASIRDGKLIKNDNIKNAFFRLRTKTGIEKPPKSLKKTSASLIRGHEKYSSLESVFLGHAPQSMADRHYAQIPQRLFDDAILWLEAEYGLKTTGNCVE